MHLLPLTAPEIWTRIFGVLTDVNFKLFLLFELLSDYEVPLFNYKFDWKAIFLLLNSWRFMIFFFILWGLSLCWCFRIRLHFFELLATNGALNRVAIHLPGWVSLVACDVRLCIVTRALDIERIRIRLILNVYEGLVLGPAR